MRRYTRRSILAAGLGVAALACTPGRPAPAPAGTLTSKIDRTPQTAPATTRTPMPTATPRLQGSEERLLLPGTPSETVASIRHSGIVGPTVMVLGGVHGNEPGGWMAADEVAGWAPAAGSLVVIPRANVTAIAGFVRTTDEVGDLNRLYPGDSSSSFAMERMAAEILALAREFEATVLLDMHESWGFYAEYPEGTGTIAIGQTITAGAGPLEPSFAHDIAAHANATLSGREQLIVRDGRRFARPTGTPQAGAANRGRSSLSAGGHTPGLTPILVEMGQERQSIERRVELHLMVARAVLEMTRIA